MRPDDWAPATIGDLCSFSSGHGFGRNDWADSGLPIIRIQHLNGSSDFDYFSGVPEDDWIVEPGELLFAWAGTQGVSFGPKLWAGPRGVLNQHIYRLRAHSGVDVRWLYYLLQVVTADIERKAHGFKSNLVHVRKADITNRPCGRPDLREQKSIARVVRIWEDGIQTADRLLRAARRLKRGLVQQLLTGRRRFPEFAGQPWPCLSFGTFLTESRLPGSNGASARKLTVKLYGKGIVPKQDDRAGSANTQYYTRRAGQFIYSKLDFLNGAFGIVPPALDGLESTLDLPAFDVASNVDRHWLVYSVTADHFYRRQLGAAHGGRKARRVNPHEFLRLKIALPPLKEQQKIAAVLNTADREINLLEQQLAALCEQKKGLMQKLLTGKVRVSVSKCAVVMAAPKKGVQ